MSVVLGFIFTCLLYTSASAIECYRCNSTTHRECLEKFIHPSTLKPDSCSDVFEARYCIKTTGYYQGVIGDQRFCSSRDLGNYCEYIQRAEDEREYRTCVYTCSTDACNSACSMTYHLATISVVLLITALNILRTP